MRYTPHAPQDVARMLGAVGMQTLSELFVDIPEHLRLAQAPDIGKGMDELTLRRHLSQLADKNVGAASAPCFLGAGWYDHHIPAALEELIRRGEFVTAYTPYQPEISQGILQSIFEYQTLICRLTGMDCTNASLYDGASALGEACRIVTAQTRRPRVLLSETVHPHYRQTAQTYAQPHMTMETIPQTDGVTDAAALEAMLDKQVAAIVLQQPNFYGVLEDVSPLIERAHAMGSLVVMVVNPMTLALLKTPGELGADYALGDGQPFGCGMNFGGPNLGFLTTRMKNIRQLPGRIVGETVDQQGRRAYVLTLQAREQHIRRDKAASNICSNQALNALAVGMYLALVGGNGLCQVAQRCHDCAAYAAEAFRQTGLSLVYDRPFFHEFYLRVADPEGVNRMLAEQGILGGLPMPEGLLLAFTEKRTQEEVDRLVRLVGRYVP